MCECVRSHLKTVLLPAGESNWHSANAMLLLEICALNRPEYGAPSETHAKACGLGELSIRLLKVCA
jgi:hypothetical protein